MIVATSDIIIGPTGESFLCRLCGVVFFLLVEPLKLHFVGLCHARKRLSDGHCNLGVEAHRDHHTAGPEILT